MAADGGATFLDDLQVAVRPRTLGEVHDLALVLLRRHLGPVLLLGVAGILPWALLDAWLVSLIERPGPACWVLLVLVFAQAPLAVAPVTCFLGQAAFHPQPSWRAALAPAWAAAPALALVVLWRAVAALLVLLLPWSLGHLTEVLCLERQGLRAGWSRASALTRVGQAREILHLLVAVVVIATAVVTLTSTVDAFEGLLRRAELWSDEEWTALLPGHALLPTIGLWLAVLYLAVVRFVNYLDLRTRFEGWDLELDLRRAAGRLPAGRP